MKYEIVGETWHTIWNSDVKPAFTNSFEVYAHEQNPKKAKIDIYLAV
jgi:predicted transcriptional regulator YdeE